MATVSELDAALIASLSGRWTKVAMVLGRVAKAPGLTFGEDDDAYEVLEERLVHLVASGAVQAEGDLTQWRFSEVRLPTVDGDTL